MVLRPLDIYDTIPNTTPEKYIPLSLGESILMSTCMFSSKSSWKVNYSNGLCLFENTKYL